MFSARGADIPFDTERLMFLNELSGELLSDKEAREYPDVVTFAFWIRRANMEKAEFLSGHRLRTGGLHAIRMKDNRSCM